MRSIGASHWGLGCVALQTTLGTNLEPCRAVRCKRYRRLGLTSCDTCQLCECEEPVCPGVLEGGGVSMWLFPSGDLP